MIEKIKQFFYRHWPVIVLSLLVGFLMILPQLIFIVKSGRNYNGINILATDCESNFLSRFQEIKEDNWGFSDIFWTFSRNKFFLSPHLDQVIMANLGMVLFLNVGQSFLFAKFILPAILFLVIYFFVFLFDPDKRLALAASSGVMLWYGLNSISGLKDFIANRFIISSPSVFSRPSIPNFGMIVLFLFLYSFYLLINRSSKKYFWLSGIIFGLSFYIYFFTWSFLIVFISVSAFWFLIKRDWLNFRKITKTAILAAIIAIPYWYNFYELRGNHQIFSSSAEQVGLTFSRQIIIGIYLIVALVLYLSNIWRKNIKKENFWFWSCLIISFFGVLNQQIISGRLLQPGHYHWYIIKPLAIIMLVWLIFGALKKYPHCLNCSVFIFIAVGFYLLSSQQALVYFNYKDEVFLHSQRYGSIYRWINQNTQKNQFFFSGTLDKGERRLITCYTHLNEYIYKNRVIYPHLTDDNKFIIFLEYRLDKITPQIAEEMFPNELKDELFYRIYGYYYRINYSDKGESAGQNQIQELLSQYKEFFNKDLREEFRRYPIDYIIWDEQLNPNWDLDNYGFLELIHQENDIGIYRILNN